MPAGRLRLGRTARVGPQQARFPAMCVSRVYRGGTYGAARPDSITRTNSHVPNARSFDTALDVGIIEGALRDCVRWRRGVEQSGSSSGS